MPSNLSLILFKWQYFINTFSLIEFKLNISQSIWWKMRKKERDNIAIKSVKCSNVKLLKGTTQNMQLQSISKYLFASITVKK